CANPLRTLPAVQFRNYKPKRPAVVRLQVLAIMPIRQHNVIVEEFVELQVRRVTAVALDENVTGLSFESHHLNQFFDPDSLPTVVVARPGGDAMEVRSLSMGRQFAKFIPSKPERILDQSVQPEIPPVWIETGCRSVTQDRKSSDQSLTRWKPV